MSSNRLESSTGHEGHSSTRIGFTAFMVGKSEQVDKERNEHCT